MGKFGRDYPRARNRAQPPGGGGRNRQGRRQRFPGIPWLQHDPEKWVSVFGKRSCSDNKPERDDDSKKSHPALARAHPGDHLGWHAIETKDLRPIAQAAGFPLHHEIPQRGSGRRDQGGALASRFGYVLGARRMLGIELGNGGKRGFEPAAEPAKRGRLLLCELILKDGGRTVGPEPRWGPPGREIHGTAMD